MRNRLRWTLFMILFMGSCVALVRPASKLADPMTDRPFRASDRTPFPVLVVGNDRSRVQLLDPPYSPPRLEAGESFLVPEDREREVESQLATSQRGVTEGNWTVEVKNIGAGKQQIQLCWVNDGYSGGVYEATSASVRPLHRKITGPGFAFVFGGLAFGMNLVVWGLGALLVRQLRARGRAQVQAGTAS
jgi:hypothetical protein